MPAKENGVQSSTISYSNVVIPDGITKNGHLEDFTLRKRSKSRDSYTGYMVDSLTLLFNDVINETTAQNLCSEALYAK